MKMSNEAQNTEEHILSIARRLFLKKGMEATSMADIARDAGINRTLLNYYFRTKEKLFEGIFSEILHRFMPALEKIVDGEGGIFEKLEMAMELYMEVLVQNPEIAIFLASEAARDPEHFFKVLRSDPSNLSKFRKVQQEILKNMRTGKLRKMPMEYFATTFFGFVLFPFVGKNIITCVFLGGDSAKFNSFIQKRKGFVMESLRKIFDPKQG